MACKLSVHAPRSLLMNVCTLKGSKSSMCSPVPMKMIGLPVAATLKVKRNNSLSNVYCTRMKSVL